VYNSKVALGFKVVKFDNTIKDNGSATIIALVAGFFGFNGIGKTAFGIGKTAFGIGLMIVGWIIAFLTAIGIFGSINNNVFAWFSIAGVGYLIFWIWQAYDANQQAKYYNEYIKRNGKEPW
jgi:uncharacterized membrane protein YtjA (UPF0391 family)